MRVRIEESTPGELTDLSAEELEAKVRKAARAAVAQVASGKLSKAQSAPPRRGGEVRVLDELGELVVQQYEARMGALRDAVQDTARGTQD